MKAQYTQRAKITEDLIIPEGYIRLAHGSRTYPGDLILSASGRDWLLLGTSYIISGDEEVIRQQPAGSERIQLLLQPEEAVVLADILGLIGGNPEGTRGHASRIYQQLGQQRHKFSAVKVDLEKRPRTDSNEIYYL